MTSCAISDNIRALYQESLIWDCHVCLPLEPGRNIAPMLKRFKDSGVTHCHVNVGMDFNPWTEVMHTLAFFRQWIQSHAQDYVLIESVADIEKAQASGKMGIAFDLEGCDPLDGDLNMVEVYYQLGVRQMLLAYSKNNQAAGGCDTNDMGLTPWGQSVIKEMNRVGMIVDGSHMGERATLEMIELSTDPVIFSHANPKGVHECRRNISDAQIKACAQSGGVIGINGVSSMLKDQKVEPDNIFEHLNYVVELVGWEHVGLGMDYVFDLDEARTFPVRYPQWFGYPNPEKIKQAFRFEFFPPEKYQELTARMAMAGYNAEHIKAILGANFMRVAKQVWK